MKKKRNWTKGMKLLAYFTGIIFIICIANIILTSVIQKKIGQALHELSPKIHADYSSIHTNLFASTVSINDLHIYFIPYNDSNHQHSFYFINASLTGINFFKIIFSSKLFISDVSLEKAEIKLDQFLLDKKDSAQAAILNHLNIPFKNIIINNLKLSKANIWLHSDTINQLLLKGNITLHEAEIHALSKPTKTYNFHIAGVECSLSDINYPMPDVLQTIRIKNLLLDSKQEILEIDSLQIIPQKNNYEYDENKINQKTRREATAGKIEITKFDVLQMLPASDQNKYSSNKNSDASSISVDDFNMHLIQYDKRQQHQHSFYFQHAVFTGVNLAKIIFNESIFINNINFEQCEIKLDPFLLNKKEPARILADLPIPFKNISINNLSLSGKVWLHSDNGNQLLLKGDLAINKAALNGLNTSDSNEFHLGAVTCNFSNINYPFDAYYTMHIRKLIMDSRKEILQIDSLKIIPGYGKFEFGKKIGPPSRSYRSNCC